MGLEKNLGSNKTAGSKNLESKNLLDLKKIWCPNKFVSKEIWIKKFGLQNLRPKKNWVKNLVKIVSVTDEIMLIWTNVARTYVAWTNVKVKFPSK